MSTGGLRGLRRALQWAQEHPGDMDRLPYAEHIAALVEVFEMGVCPSCGQQSPRYEGKKPRGERYCEDVYHNLREEVLKTDLAEAFNEAGLEGEKAYLTPSEIDAMERAAGEIEERVKLHPNCQHAQARVLGLGSSWRWCPECWLAWEGAGGGQSRRVGEVIGGGHALGLIHDDDPALCGLSDCFGEAQEEFLGYCSAWHYELGQKVAQRRARV
jgi:hypothetical protein